MAAFLPVAVLLSLLVTGAHSADGYGSQQTTPSPSTPSSLYTPTPATPPPPPTPSPPKPAAHGHDNNDDDKKLVVVHVEGVVVCQSCESRGSPSLAGARPLPKAQVVVTCRDRKNRVMARQCAADSNGYFHAEFGVKRAAGYWEKDPRRACFVRLLSSPDPRCNVISNIVHRGLEGAPVRDEGKHWIDGDSGIENVVHAAGPLAFRPAACPPTRRY